MPRRDGTLAHLVPRRQQAAVGGLEAGAVVSGGAQRVGVDEEHAPRGVVRGSVRFLGVVGSELKSTERNGDGGGKEIKEGRGMASDRGGGGMKLVTRLAAEARNRLSGSHKKAESSLVCLCVRACVRIIIRVWGIEKEEQEGAPF